MNYEDFLFRNLERAANKMMRETSNDPKDQVTLDVPLFIRMLELAREDIKSDEELHKVVERVLALKNQGTLTMDDYPEIVGGDLASTMIPPQQDPELSDIRKLAGIR